MAHSTQNYPGLGAYPPQNAYYYPASGNAHAHTPHDYPMLYQPSEYLLGAGMLVSSAVMAPAQEPAVTPRPRTRNPHYDLQTSTQQNNYQQQGSSHTSTAAPAPVPVMPSFGYHPPHPHPQSTFQHSAFSAQPSQSLMIPSDYTYTIEPALVPLNSADRQSTLATQRRAVREPATRPARVGTLAPDSLLFQPFVPNFTQPQAAPHVQQPQPVNEVIEDDAWLQFLAQYPPAPLGMGF